ncbi:transporter substrate-binding domain-containing protein [Baaleninema sp.]|uniref:transporter substrate-binding domain-containing protein n=1 Tax=Baaleninema sp. TaxID=3101197 RepID=UPI003D00E49C
MIKPLATLLSSVLLPLSPSPHLPISLSPPSVLSDIEKTGELRIGIQDDAIPFGYRDSNRNLRGYCLAFAELLQNEVRDRLDSSVLPIIKLIPSSPSTRFDLIRSGRIHIECGPNTIRDDIEGVTFSRPFFLTGLRLLVRQNARDRFENRESWDGLTIGVVADTLAEEMLVDRYPDADLVRFRGSVATAQGVTALQGSLDGFIEDEVLLLGEMVKLQLSLSEYSFFPEDPLTCELYGMVLPDNDPEWRAFVNQLIASDRADNLLRTWFRDVADYILPTIDYCREERRIN